MIIKNVTQGSQEWADLRAQHFTASEAPAMAGVSKYTSRADLLHQKFTGVAPEVTAAQQRLFDKGHAAEAAARPKAEEIIGQELFPVTGVSEEYPSLLASLDGCTMIEDVIWEHKLWNEKLAAAVRANDLPDHYTFQMDQQLLVSGAERCLFMCSDGTEENMVWCWYEADEKRFGQIIAGWQQFKDDLDAYHPAEQKVAAQGEAPKELPKLHIDLTGAVTASNLPEFKTRALAMIEGIKTELATDQDFADAGETVKFLQKGEKQLKDSKQAALDQTASISELFNTIDELSEAMRQKRLKLEKLVKAEKDNRRLEIHRKATEAFDEFLANLDCPVEPEHSLNITEAMKGKKTIASLLEAADGEVARAKVECKQLSEKLVSNHKLLKDQQGEYAMLFSDWKTLIQKAPDDLMAVIKSRITEHKEAEQARLDAEREKIRQEESEKASEAAPSHNPSGAPAVHGPIDTSRLNAAADNFKPASQVAQPEMVSVPRKEYEQLLKDQAKLYALEDAGVAHWSKYSEALKQLEAA